MLHLNTVPVDFGTVDANSSQYEYNRDMPLIGQSFPQQYAEDTISLNETNYQYFNQNDSIPGWIGGCQVVAFIPDHPTSHNSVTRGCYDYTYQSNYMEKSYRFYSNKPAQSTLRVNLKRKRKRTIFTTEQIVFLEGVFQRKPYITRDERVAITNRLLLSEKAIKIWFQNRRRMTDKKLQEYTESDSPSSIDTTDSFSDRLTVIEEEIKENTDENGYVRLNDQVMSELVSIIDDYLSRDTNLINLETCSNSTETEDFVMYEPISPASSDFNL